MTKAWRDAPTGKARQRIPPFLFWVAGYKLRREPFSYRPLPKGTTGKVQRRTLKKVAAY